MNAQNKHDQIYKPITTIILIKTMVEYKNKIVSLLFFFPLKLWKKEQNPINTITLIKTMIAKTHNFPIKYECPWVEFLLKKLSEGKDEWVRLKKKIKRKRNLGLKKNSCARKCPTSQTQWVWTQQEEPQCLYFCVSSIFSAPFCSSSISYAAPWTARQEVRVRVREGNKIQ